MSVILPRPRRIPVAPRPRHGELSGSYLTRIAQANVTDLRTFAGLLGSAPSSISADGADLPVMVLTLNDAAFARLLAYTGLDGDDLIKAIPSLEPRTFRTAGEPPAIRVSFLRVPAADCPGCRLRRGGAHADPRVFPHKAACLRHGYWLYGEGRGQRIDFTAFPDLAAAQRRLDKIAARHGPTAAMRAYELAGNYLQRAWRIDHHPHWYLSLTDRWKRRVQEAGAVPPEATWQFPAWAIHPECTALAAMFASPYWATLSVPAPDRRHRRFYQRLISELAIDDGRPVRTMKVFKPLPGDIQEEARWGRLLSDPGWGSPPPASAIPRTIPFFDITNDYERSISDLIEVTWPGGSALCPRP